MKKIFLLPIVGIALLASCDDGTSHMAYMEQIKDTVFKTYPTVAGVTVKVSDDAKDITIILGDKHLYEAPIEMQQKEAYDVSIMALHIFGKENTLKTGSVIISKDEKSEQPDVANTKIITINIDSLKKAGY
jgi:hypothetical protein